MGRVLGTFLFIGLGFAVAACAGDGTGPVLDDAIHALDLRPLPAMVHPADNPPDSTRVALGRLLFFDPVLSGGRDVACGTCHHPRFGMADGLPLPLGPSGVGLGPERRLTDPTMVPEARNSPTVINAGFNQFFGTATADGFLFWDGRRRRLENLVTLPLREFTEMRGSVYSLEHALDSVLARLRAIPEYEDRFRAAFSDRSDATLIDSASVAQALAQFVRSLAGNRSRYDQFVNGDGAALTTSEKRGLLLFHGKAGCAVCHAGPMFSDFAFHVVGAAQRGPGFQTTPHEDFGRWNVTHLETDRWRFRTPSLRNVALTAPYTHAGTYGTLRDVVRFFAAGGGDHPAIPRTRLDQDLADRGLSDAEIDELVAFLETLTDAAGVTVPGRVPSGLTPPG